MKKVRRLPAARIRANGQITIPREVREAARLDEGDPVFVEVVKDGILLRPQKLIDATQAWFWEDTWQAGERAASADIAAGRVETFETNEDLLASLEDD